MQLRPPTTPPPVPIGPPHPGTGNARGDQYHDGGQSDQARRGRVAGTHWPGRGTAGSEHRCDPAHPDDPGGQQPRYQFTGPQREQGEVSRVQGVVGRKR